MSAPRILLLGGTGDALKIARALGPHHVYSLADRKSVV
ncbi:cobalt-precorrin-6x reductase [Burkholderia dolosa]|nr:cobalt-precorrin-6x reductase [Burkholderia dolosa]